MKNLFKILSLAICLGVSGVLLCACKTKTTSIYIVEDTVQKYIELNSNWSTDQIVVKKVLSDQSEEQIAHSLLTFSTIDTSVTGKQTLTVTYTEKNNNFTDDIEVTVFQENVVEELIFDSATLPTVVAMNSTWSTDSIVVKARMTNGDLVTVNHSNLTFTSINTSSATDQTLIVTYNQNTNISVNATIKVYGNITSVEIIDSSVANSIVFGDSLDLSNLQLKVNYENNHSEIVTSDFTTNFNDDEIGESYLYATYKGHQASKLITIEKNYTLLSFDAPLTIQGANGYSSNSNLKNTFNSTGSTGTVGFEITGNQYVVGDANQFIFSPTMSVVYNDLSTDVINDYKSNIKVYMYNDGNSQFELLENNINTYVEIDNENHTVDFTEAARNKIFKISVLPYYITESELETIEACEFEFKVIEGYNVYNAKQLSVIDNLNVNEKWTDFKTLNNIPLDINVNTVVLHNNITITDNDIPSVHFWTAEEVKGATDAERVVNSLKDSTDGDIGYIYRRSLTSGHNFTIEGNYFTLSAQEISLIVREQGASVSKEGEAITSHTSLIKVESDNSTSQFNLNNIQLFGNANK